MSITNILQQYNPGIYINKMLEWNAKTVISMSCNTIASTGTQRQDKYIYGGCGKLGKLQIQPALDKDLQ